MAVSLQTKLQLNIADFSAKLTTASKQMRTFAKTMSDSYGDINAKLSKQNLGLKDTARIVQGIMISQAFYSAARAISNATSAVTEFNEKLDYAQVTYSALFGSADIATDFSKVLQQASMNTIFGYEQLADSTKKMLAYGVPYKNLMFISEGLTNLGAMSGDAEALDRIALALGQIYTKGKLSAEEMRQLANAYVPIYDIVKTSFGLTGDQMKSVGDLNLPAYQVINAIVDYANAKFGSVGDAAMYTITGLKNKIEDTLKVMGHEMTTPLTVAWKSFLSYVANGLNSIRKLYASGGSGAIFKALVPDESAQTTIRAFVANLINLFKALTSIVASVAPYVGLFAQAFMIAFNTIIPPVLYLTNILAAALKAIVQNTYAAHALKGAFVVASAAIILFAIHAVRALVVTTVAKAVTQLSKALLILSTIITKNWVLSGLAMLAIGLVAIAASSGNADTALGNLFKTLNRFGGTTSPEDIFKETTGAIDDSADAADQFNNRLEEGAEATDELADSTKKAAKATKSLLSFDEVFKLPEPTSTDNKNTTDTDYDVADMLKGIGAIGEAIIPDIPDFSDYIDEFTDSLFGGLSDAFSTKLKNTTIGAILGAGIGAILGGLLGGPGGALLGAKIGALAGGIIGLFWDDIKKHLGIPNTGALASLMAGALGGILGFSVGGVPGAVLGAAIGLLAGGLMSSLWQQIGDKANKGPDSIEAAQISSAIGTGLGGIIGFAIGGPGGALIGAGVGALIGGLFGLFKENITSYFKTDNGITTAIVTGFGGILGFAVGGPLGAVAGAAAGALLSTFGNYIKDNWSVITGSFDSKWTEFSTEIEGGLETTRKVWADKWTEIKTNASDKWDEIKTNSSTWWSDFKITTSADLEYTRKVWSDKWSEVKTNASTIWGKIKTNASTWWGNLKLDTTTSLDDIKKQWSDKWNEVNENASTTWSDIKTYFNTWFDGFNTNNSTNLDTVKKAWSNKWDAISLSASTTWASIKTNFGTWWSNLKSDTSTGLSDIKDTWSLKWDEIKTNAGVWWEGLRLSMKGWLETKIWAPISDFFNITTFWNRISGMLGAIKDKLSSWWDSITEMFDSTSASASVSVSASTTSTSGSSNTSSTTKTGHALGGIFNREHIARFAEGNKAEAVIPLENASAMQPFVNAISQGILEGLAPTLVQADGNSNNNLPPMYVGTLVADERGLKQLYKKFELIQVQENARRGITT